MAAGSRHPFYGVAGDALADSAEQLFAACKRPMFKLSNWNGVIDSPIHLAAAIGFTAEHLRGALVLALPTNAAVALSPLSGEQRKALADDWICELANQLLGRVKNKLLAWNIHVQLSIAMALRANSLKLQLDDRQVVGICLTDGHLKAYAWIDALAGSDLKLRQTGVDAQAEGDMVLF